MENCYDIVKSLRRTEKGAFLGPERKYLFEVDHKANKIQIKKAVEEIYKVKVESVNVCIVPGKRKRVRHQLGYTSDWKKAFVTLEEGFNIEIT